MEIEMNKNIVFEMECYGKLNMIKMTGSSWIGWKRNGTTGRLEILFEFHTARQFQSLTFYLGRTRLAQSKNSVSIILI